MSFIVIAREKVPIRHVIMSEKIHLIGKGLGSEVAKQAADIILMDDNFSSIVRAVKEGRVMYENIKKLLAYTMPHSFPEVWPIIINFCFGFPQGITALQVKFYSASKRFELNHYSPLFS